MGKYSRSRREDEDLGKYSAPGEPFDGDAASDISTGAGRRSSRRDQKQQAAAPPPRRAEREAPASDHPPQWTADYNRAGMPRRSLAGRRRGSVAMTGRVVSIRERPRKKGLLNHYFASLFNGERFCTEQKGFCLTIDSTDEDFLSIDRAQRRTFVVNLNGEMYYGDIAPEDIVCVSGCWDSSGVLNADSVYNQTNGTTIKLSTSIPALAVRLATLLALAVLAGTMARGSSGVSAGGLFPGVGNALKTVLLIAVLIVVAAAYVRMQLRCPTRGFRRGLGWIAAAVAVILLYRFAPDTLYLVLTAGIMLWGIWYMIKGIFS